MTIRLYSNCTRPLDPPRTADADRPGVDPVFGKRDIEGSVTTTLLGVLVVAGVLAFAGWAMTLPVDALPLPGIFQH